MNNQQNQNTQQFNNFQGQMTQNQGNEMQQRMNFQIQNQQQDIPQNMNFNQPQIYQQDIRMNNDFTQQSQMMPPFQDQLNQFQQNDSNMLQQPGYQFNPNIQMNDNFQINQMSQQMNEQQAVGPHHQNIQGQIEMNMDLLKLLQGGDLSNLSDDQIKLLHQYAMDDGIDLNQLSDVFIRDGQQKPDQNDEKQMSQNVVNQQFQENNQLPPIQQTQIYQNDADFQRMNQNMNMVGNIQQNKTEQEDEQLLQILQNQAITVEQLMQLKDKGIDVQTLKMAGLRIINSENEMLDDQELMKKLQDLKSILPNQSIEKTVQHLQSELVRENPDMDPQSLALVQNLGGFVNSHKTCPLQQLEGQLQMLDGGHQGAIQQIETQVNNQLNTNVQNPETQINNFNVNLPPHPLFEQNQPKSEQQASPKVLELQQLDENVEEENQMRDIYFEQQLRQFYRNLMERLPGGTLEKMSKKSKQFCEQINKAQSDFIIQRNKMGQNQSPRQNQIQVNDENDGNSSFYSILYGQNASLNPDPFINDILNILSNFPDLRKQMKRFLPEDEEEIQEMEQNVLKLKQSMNNDEVPMGTELDRSYDETTNINKLKRDAYQNLFKLLEEYGETRESLKTFIDQDKQKRTNEALQLISTKIMKVAESYLKYVTDDVKIQIDQNRNKKEQPNYLEIVEKQMSLILSVIPSEIIDSFNVSQSSSSPVKKAEEKYRQKILQKNQRYPTKRSGRGKMQPESEDDLQNRDLDGNSDGLIDIASDIDQLVSEEEEIEEEAEEEIEEEIEEEQVEEEEEQQDQQLIEQDEEQENQQQINSQQQLSSVYNQENSGRKACKLNPLTQELNTSYQSKLKDLNKTEIKVFESVQKVMKSQQEWHDFGKLMAIYMEGVVSLSDLFTLFKDKFGNRLTDELQKELEQLLPSRDHNRRLLSDILKPWNDLENQKFVKLDDTSYFKIGELFPLPICTVKCNPKNKGFYAQFLNERYLQLSTSSENFKFKVRNVNEDMIFKNEDEMYKLDTQIEMFEKCYKIMDQEIRSFDAIKEPKLQKNYEFPIQKLKPHVYFWEKRYKDLIPILQHKPFKRDFMICMRTGLFGKLQELQNYKLDQQSTFEEIYRRNFMKSLDYRSFQYKDFMKKYLQKQTHVQMIRQIAQSNHSHELRHINQMKGSVSKESPYYHSFGSFLRHNFSSFDPESCQDFPMNMDYIGIDQFAHQMPQKFPHLRLIFKDETAIKITLKLVQLNIRFSTNHYNNERPKLTETCKFLIQQFMNITDFKAINKSCEYGKIENLTNKQVMMFLDKDTFKYYKIRCSQLNGEDVDQVDFQQNENNEENMQFLMAPVEKLRPVKLEISNIENHETKKQEKKNDKIVDENTPNKDESIGQQNENSVEELMVDNSSQQSSSLRLREIALDQYKSLNINQNSNNTEKQKIKLDELKYLPHFCSKKDYRLFYAPFNVFMFFEFFYALYERIVMAKQLVKDKVELDLMEMPLADKLKYKILHSETNKLDQNLVNLFISERFEYLLKGIFALTNFSSNSNQPYGGVVQQVVQSTNIMDNNKFEDYSRAILGKNAFMLFQVDKLSNQVLKQLQVINSDIQCQKSFKLFKVLNEQSSKHENFESVYQAQYAHQIIDQFSLSESILNAKNFQRKSNQACNHLALKFNAKSQQNEQSPPLLRLSKSESHQYQSANKESITSVSQTNFMMYRMMYSPVSNTMSIHYMNINPYQLPHLNYRNIMRDNFTALREATVVPNVPNMNKDGFQKCKCHPNKIGDDKTQPPVFLKRNLKQMFKHRQRQEMDKNQIVKHEGMSIELVPQINQLINNPSRVGEDIFVYKRKTKLFANGQSQLALDLQKQTEQNNQILKRLKRE